MHEKNSFTQATFLMLSYVTHTGLMA